MGLFSFLPLSPFSLFSFLVSRFFFFFSSLFSVLSFRFSLSSFFSCSLSSGSLLFPASGAPCPLITCTALQPAGGNQVDGLPPDRNTGAGDIALNSVSRFFMVIHFFSLLRSLLKKKKR